MGRRATTASRESNTLGQVRSIRDDIDRRVHELIAELDAGVVACRRVRVANHLLLESVVRYRAAPRLGASRHPGERAKDAVRPFSTGFVPGLVPRPR